MSEKIGTFHNNFFVEKLNYGPLLLWSDPHLIIKIFGLHRSSLIIEDTATILASFDSSCSPN
jgi:hypothetical protein